MWVKPFGYRVPELATIAINNVGIVASLLC